MDEIGLAGAPLQNVKRRFKRQNTILQGQYPNVNLVMGSTCEAGCKAIVRIQLDQLKADGRPTREADHDLHRIAVRTADKQGRGRCPRRRRLRQGHAREVPRGPLLGRVPGVPEPARRRDLELCPPVDGGSEGARGLGAWKPMDSSDRQPRLASGDDWLVRQDVLRLLAGLALEPSPFDSRRCPFNGSYPAIGKVPKQGVRPRVQVEAEELFRAGRSAHIDAHLDPVRCDEGDGTNRGYESW